MQTPDGAAGGRGPTLLWVPHGSPKQPCRKLTSPKPLCWREMPSEPEHSRPPVPVFPARAPDLRVKDTGLCCTHGPSHPPQRPVGNWSRCQAQRQVFSCVTDEGGRLRGFRGLAQSLFIGFTASLWAGVGPVQQRGQNWGPSNLKTSRWEKKETAEGSSASPPK